jgi:hypothetical protein
MMAVLMAVKVGTLDGIGLALMRAVMMAVMKS